MDFFSSQPGVAVLVPDAGLPTAIGLQGWNSRTLKACISGLVAASDVNIQFMHTLRNVIHFDTFGDRISEMNISAIAFAGDCGTGRESGTDLLWQYYLKNKASTRGVPLALTMGAKLKMSGFLTGLRFEASDPASAVARFTFRINFVPPESV